MYENNLKDHFNQIKKINREVLAYQREKALLNKNALMKQPRKI